MKVNQRHRELLSLLSPGRERAVGDLAGSLGISEATVRRDLVALARTGKVIRTHGGVLLHSSVIREASFRDKAATAVEAKRRIGRAAAMAVPVGACVYVDAGTTCLEAARSLIERGDCRLITNSIPVLVEACRADVAVTAIGGEVRGITRALVGAPALGWLDALRSDIALIGASGLDPDSGIFTTEPLEAGVKRAAIAGTGAAWLLADGDKWGIGAAFRFARWGEFARWFVDHEVDLEPTGAMDLPEVILA